MRCVKCVLLKVIIKKTLLKIWESAASISSLMVDIQSAYQSLPLLVDSVITMLSLWCNKGYYIIFIRTTFLNSVVHTSK